MASILIENLIVAGLVEAEIATAQTSSLMESREKNN
jgi:hypothetical protein